MAASGSPDPGDQGTSDDPPGKPARKGRRALAIDVGPLRRHRDDRLRYFGQFVSFLGTMMTHVALPLQVYALTRSSLAIGLLGLAELIPLLFTTFVGGAPGGLGGFPVRGRRRRMRRIFAWISRLRRAAPAARRGRRSGAGHLTLPAQRLLASAGAISITLLALAAEVTVPCAPAPAMPSTTAQTTATATGIDTHHQLFFGAIRHADRDTWLGRRRVGV